MTDREVCALAIEKFGKWPQLRQLQEECAEVVVAVNHLQRGRITDEEFLGECADVEIMILQARVIYGDEAVDRVKAEKIKRLYALAKPEEKELSLRGQEWAAFGLRAAAFPEKLTAGFPAAEKCMEEVEAECLKFVNSPNGNSLLRIALLAWLASSVNSFTEFRQKVADHIEQYTVPQYGDKGKDYATGYTPSYCASQILKYRHRFGTNAREGQQEIDLMKIAHFACLAFFKMGNKIATVTLQGEMVPNKDYDMGDI